MIAISLDTKQEIARKGRTGIAAKILEAGDETYALCLACGPSTDEDGFTRVGRPVIPRPVGGTVGEAIELAKANRFKALGTKEKQIKNKKFSGDNNGLDMSPSECIVIPLIQDCSSFEVTDTAPVVVRPSGNYGDHGSGAIFDSA